MELITEEKIKKNKLYIVKGQTKSFEPVIAKYKIEENSQTICNGNISEKYYKEVPKSYYSEIKYDDEYFKRIEKKLSDDWEGDEEIFVPEEETSKPFNTPTILGCMDN